MRTTPITRERLAARVSGGQGCRDDLPPHVRLHRQPHGRVVAGVASGLAEHLALPVVGVRLALVVLTVAGGSGVLAYGAFWLLLPTAPPDSAAGAGQQSRASRRQVAAFALLSAIGLLVAHGLGLDSGLALPLLAVVVGVGLVWRQADQAQRTRWRASAAAGDGQRAWRALAGVVLFGIGLAGFLATRGDLAKARDGLLSTVLILGGLVLLALPWVLRTVGDLQVERRERIRSQERAELSAQLHDSVLQTLALIQRAADDPREVARLARSSERELRGWLYRPAGQVAFAAGLEAVAAEVEEAHGVRVEVVVVGDAPRDERLGALTAAAREAVVNAAKHSGAPAVQVYAEVEPSEVTVFVRDRGRGFAPQDVPADRYGLAQSVHARVARAAGQTRVRSAPGEGTEVRLTVPR